MNKAVGIIPARWASTRFPGKPLHLIGNKPLLQRVWERCQRAKKLDQVISGTDRIAEVASKASRFGIIINIQGDEPLLEPALLDRLVNELRSDRQVDIVTAAHPF